MNAAPKVPRASSKSDEMERLLQRHRELLSDIERGARPLSMSRGIAEAAHGLIGLAAELLRVAKEACDTPPEGQPNPGIATLSRRERDVLRHVLAGRTSKEIARLLHVSPSSVSTYRSRLMTKLDARRGADLVRRALELGLAGNDPLAPLVTIAREGGAS